MDENVKRLYDKAGLGSYTGGAGLQAAIKQLVTADHPAPRSFESLTSLVELLLAHPRTAVFVTEKSIARLLQACAKCRRNRILHPDLSPFSQHLCKRDRRLFGRRS